MKLAPQIGATNAYGALEAPPGYRACSDTPKLTLDYTTAAPPRRPAHCLPARAGGIDAVQRQTLSRQRWERRRWGAGGAHLRRKPRCKEAACMCARVCRKKNGPYRAVQADYP